MWFRRRSVGTLMVAAAAGLAASPPTGVASSLDGCAQRVVRDWSADGRVDRNYPLACYRTAIGALPEDLRAYTDAEQEIRHAMAHAQARTDNGRQAAHATRSPTAAAGRDEASPGDSSASFPYRALVVAAPALVLLGAGAAGWLATRRR